MGKFELSSETPNVDYGGGNSTSLTIRILPNVISWRKNRVTNFWKVIDNTQVSNNIYGLTIDREKADSHMLTNMEWGAVAYLTHSKYGRCNENSCTEIGINSHNGAKTGCGPQSSGSTSSGSTCNAYTSTLGLTASTTGNIYGVYDMSGGKSEYVMGNMSSAAGSYEYYASSGGTNFTYNDNNSKYITIYANGTSDANQTAYNRGLLGDATSEIVKSPGVGWYSDSTFFLCSSISWFVRGGYYDDGAKAGVLYFSYSDGYSGVDFSTRASLAVFTQ